MDGRTNRINKAAFSNYLKDQFWFEALVDSK